MLKNAGIIGEKAKQETDEVHLKIMAFITSLFECIMEIAHLPGDFDVYRIELLKLDPGIPAR
jgi:hypothetical protein